MSGNAPHSIEKTMTNERQVIDPKIMRDSNDVTDILNKATGSMSKQPSFSPAF